MMNLRKTVGFILFCCVLFLSLALVATANLVRDPSDYIVNGQSYDFEGETPKLGVINSGNGGKLYWSYNNKDFTENVYPKSTSNDPYDSDENHYINLTYNNRSYSTTANAYIAFELSDFVSAMSPGKHELVSNYDFAVADFEIMSDKYYCTYIPAGKTSEVTELVSAIPEGATVISCRLALPEKLDLYAGVRSYTNAAMSGTAIDYCYVKIEYLNGEWCVLANQGGEDPVDTGVRLDNAPGEWIHFTYLFKINKENPDTSVQYVYMNGEYIGHCNIAKSGAKFMYFEEIRMQVAQSYAKADNYSVCFDNLSLNFYKNDYTSYGVYGLDEYFSDGLEYTDGIYNCGDVVYNDSYKSVNPVATVDNKSYYTMESALSAIVKGSTVTLMRGYDRFIPTVGSLTVKAAPSVPFKIDSSCEESYSVVKTEKDGVYEYRIESSAKIDVMWQDADGTLLHEGDISAGMGLDASEISAKNRVTDLSGGKYREILCWSTDKIAGDIMTEAEFNALLESGESVIVRPVYGDEVTVGGYMISYTDEFGIERLYVADDSTAGIQNANNTCARNEYSVTLYSDVNIDLTANGGSGFCIAADKTVWFDLNGNDIYHVGDHCFYNLGAFSVYDRATLNLYNSDTENCAEIYQALYYEEKIGSQALIEINAGNSCTVNIGDIYHGIDKVREGSNLAFYCGTLIDVPETESPMTDSESFDINLNGGEYYGIIYPSYAVFAIGNVDVDLDINGAIIYCGDNGGAVFQIDCGYPSSAAQINMKNSVIVANEKAVFHGMNDSTVAVFEDAVIYGLGYHENMTGSSTSPHVTFRGRNYICSSDLEHRFFGAESGSILAKNNGGAVELPSEMADGLKISYKNISFDQTYGFKLIVPEEKTLMFDATAAYGFAINYVSGYSEDEIVKSVVWQDTDGEAYITEYWCIGSDVEHRHTAVLEKAESREVFPIVEEMGNGWFDIGYSGFERSDKSGHSTVSDSGNVFIPVTGIIANVDVDINVSVFGNFRANVYLPIYEGVDLPEGVEYKGVFRDKGLTSAASCESYTSTDGKIQTYTYGFFDSNKISEAFTVYIAFLAEHDGIVADLVYRVSFDLARYAELVMGEDDVECGSESAVLMIAILEYATELYEYNNSEGSYSEAERVIAAHTDCECVIDTSYSNLYSNMFTEKEKAASDADYAKLVNSGVKGAKFVLNVDQSAMALYVDESMVYVPTEGAAPTVEDLQKIAYVSYSYIGTGNRLNQQFTGNFTIGEICMFGEVSCYEFRLNVVSACNIDSIVTVTLLNANGDVICTENGDDAVGEYSLAKFITDNSDVAVTRALYALAHAVRDYKTTLISEQ